MEETMEEPAFELDLAQFGERVKKIREHFGMNQKDLAEVTDSTQNLVSRLEKGQGCSIEYFFRLLRYLASRNVIVPNLFLSVFSIEIVTNPYNTNKEQMKAIIREVEQQTNANLEKLWLLANAL